MDAVNASRIDANIAARLAGSAGLPAVSGNAKRVDAMTLRRTAKPDAGSAAGDADSTDIRTANPRDPNRSLTGEEQAKVRELRTRDRQVRAHERAHLSAAGPHARGGASFTFETGPDGRRYAVGGEVSIDTAKIPGDPAATLAKARQVRRAALAPADPSPRDRQVAAQAAAMARAASAELAQTQREGAPDNAVDQAYSISDSATTLINLIA